jgi:DNA mismatch repair protein MutL
VPLLFHLIPSCNPISPESEVILTSRIRILPENITNKIAAGEVVERPASVVKELVENAIDAGCHEVAVQIEAGGKRLIKVVDDGSGMSRNDALLALERHATSKITTDADLYALTTLGFRGEALPSIASVSRFTLSTRERGEIEGTEIYAEGGRINEVKACGMAEGTSIEVRNLFFNTPARLKFMKSGETEAGHVAELLTRLALSRPDIRFSYHSDSKQLFRMTAGDLQKRILELLGSDISKSLFPLEYEDGGVRVSGYISRPDCNRATTSHMYTFVNRRFIRDKVVQHAILQAYRNMLERGRYPLLALFIDLPDGAVDVNVHPTKHEVRFREQGRVHDIIQGAIETVLRSSPWLKSPSMPSTPHTPSTAVSRVAEVKESLARYSAEVPTQSTFTAFKQGGIQKPAATIERQAPVVETGGFFSSLHVIGQLNAAYLLCQDGSDLVIIDQHAAHERIVYEQLRNEHDSNAVESQGLLFPEQLEFTHAEAALLKEREEELFTLGFELEHFGGKTWLLKAVPRLISGGNVIKTLRDILDELRQVDRTRSFATIRDNILATIACHSVIRGPHPLTTEEIATLLMRMDATDFASSCPHGRPVYRTITLPELERMFKRA